MGIQINDALERIRLAQEQHAQALACTDPMERHATFRLAYGSLAQAASDAYMYFSANKDTNLFSEGGIQTWAREELEVITRTVGAQYHVQGLVSASRMEAEFQMWLDRVRGFVGKLNESRRLDDGKVAAKDWKEEELRRKRKQAENFEKHMFDRTGAFGGMY